MTPSIHILQRALSIFSIVFMSYSVVILSKTAANVSACIAAIHQNEADAYVIVVDDGVDWKAVPAKARPQCRVIGQQPFCFARNANLGLQYAFETNDHDHAILLNDDALLRTKNGFTALTAEHRSRPHFGIVSAATNYVGNPNQLQRDGLTIRREERMLCFVCVSISRLLWHTIGTLDEQFTGYGFEDDDYSKRSRMANYRLGVFDRCFVDHVHLKSTFRGDAYPTKAFDHNRRLYEAKYAGAMIL